MGSDVATGKYKTYTLDGIEYLPHYVIEGLYAVPGTSGRDLKAISESVLVQRKAKMTVKTLWMREYPPFR